MGDRKDCKACNSPNREWIEDRLNNNIPQADIIRGLAEKGETFNYMNLKAHKNHIPRPDPFAGGRASVIEGLKAEAAKVPPVLAAPYFALIQWFEQSQFENIKAETAIKAAEAITRITGMRTKQALLLEFMVHRFQSPSTDTAEAQLSAPGASHGPPSTPMPPQPIRGELVRLHLPEDQMEPDD